MEKNKMKKTVSTIIIIAVIIIVAWFIVVYPLIRFNQNEKEVLNAGKRYFEINSSRLPSEGDVTTVSLRTLLDQRYIDDLRTAYNRDTCSGKESFVKVKRKQGKYQYYVYLKCGVMSSNVDHEGPKITLKGKDTIYVERGSQFKDPGIESVRDNTDGNIKISNVHVKGDVDTSNNGSYAITYSVVDSFDNKTEITRQVIVSQSLTKTVEKETDSSNLYKGNISNNYIRFSGQLFRIVGVNSDGTVKIVSNDNISNVDYNSLKEWLNNYYYNHISDDSKEYVVRDYEWCNDTIDKNDVDKNTICKQKNKQTVAILAVSDYNNSLKEGESYLYPTAINWTYSEIDTKKAWTTRELFFDTNSKYLDYNRTYNFNVRPAIVLKKDIKIISGDGTLGNPYDIGDFKKGKGGEKTTKRYSGEFVSYAGVLYRIVESNVGGYTKVISINDVIGEDVKYGNGDTYNPTKNGNIGYYIENNVSKYIKTGIFVKHEVEVPIYNNTATYTGKKAIKKYNVKFAAPSMYEMYSSYSDSVWYIESSENINVRYASSFNGTVYYFMDDIDNITARTRFTGYLKKSSVIVSGSGTYADPYKLSY